MKEMMADGMRMDLERGEKGDFLIKAESELLREGGGEEEEETAKSSEWRYQRL